MTDPRDLLYAATRRCSRCGAGLACVVPPALPRRAWVWECSAVILGEAEPAGHDLLPCADHAVLAEDQRGAEGETTRPPGTRRWTHDEAAALRRAVVVEALRAVAGLEGKADARALVEGSMLGHGPLQVRDALESAVWACLRHNPPALDLAKRLAQLALEAQELADPACEGCGEAIPRRAPQVAEARGRWHPDCYQARLGPRG